MIKMICYRRSDGVEFEREFDSAYKARIFYLRCEHGRKIGIAGIQGYDDLEEYYYIIGENI